MDRLTTLDNSILTENTPVRDPNTGEYNVDAAFNTYLSLLHGTNLTGIVITEFEKIITV